MRYAIVIAVLAVSACGTPESETNNTNASSTPTNNGSSNTNNPTNNAGTNNAGTNNATPTNGDSNNATTTPTNNDTTATNNGTNNTTATNNGTTTATNNTNGPCTDAQEPNDTRDDAHPAVSGDSVDGRVCGSDDLDLFSVDLTTGQTFTATLDDFPAETDNLDMTLFTAEQAADFQRSDTGVAFTFATGETPEVLTYTVEADGTYYLLVFNNNETEAPYTVSVDVQ